jgi:hypothetical protein
MSTGRESFPHLKFVLSDLGRKGHQIITKILHQRFFGMTTTLPIGKYYTKNQQFVYLASVGRVSRA